MVYRILLRRKTLVAFLCWTLLIATVLHIWLMVMQVQNVNSGSLVSFHFLTVIFGSSPIKGNDVSLSEIREYKHLYDSNTMGKKKKHNLIKTLNKQNKKVDDKHSYILKSPIRAEQGKVFNTTQQCSIPRLNPFHEDVQIYIHYGWRNKVCRLWDRRGQVKDGVLTLNLENVQRAGFYYVHRKNDDENYYSEWQSLRHTQNAITENEVLVCLLSSTHNLIVTPTPVSTERLENDLQYNTTLDVALLAPKNTTCTPDHQFLLRKDGTIQHVSSGRCMVPAEKIKDTPITFTREQCSTSSQSKFHLRKDGKILHLATSQCLLISIIQDKELRAEDRSKYLALGNCSQGTNIHFYQMEYGYKDLNVMVPLKHDIIRVEYVLGHTSYTEHFIYPKKDFVSKERLRLQKRAYKDPNKLNVLFLMIDSISRASAQRYLNATYKMLEGDPNSVIMKGQTIVGDGTTAQVLAMFVGDQERNLPEARRGFDDAGYLNRWPWIWKDFEKVGYTTLYGEDMSQIGTFNYRLMGFDQNETPTTKYLRPWWIEIDPLLQKAKKHSTDCPHKVTFEYLKDMFREYNQEKKFIFHASNLGHNEPSRATSIDDNLVEFFQHLNKTKELDNTVVVIFGDHGDRTAQFRATMQGKLEERLPFLSITFPSWFHKKFPVEVKNLQHNSEVLTSHYDVYATSRHLVTFPYITYQHKYGRSLFTDITSLNRKCEDAGVDENWCPCLQYEPLDVNSDFVVKTTLQVVMRMNTELEKSPVFFENCLPFQLKEIIRAGKRITNKHVEQFKETFQNEDCNECGTVVNEKGFTKQIYELVFQVTPSDGKFELTVEYDTEKKRLVFDHEFLTKISRLNKYGDQPKCVARKYPYFRKFCFCRQQS